MNKNLISRTFTLALLLGLSPSFSHAEALGTSVYLEVQEEELNLSVPSTLSDGARALVPSMDLPQESIIAVDIRTLNVVLNSSTNNPNSLNFPFVNSESDQHIQRGTQWMCGLRVVDATDEELREGTEIERTDFCMPLVKLKSLKVMDTNTTLVREALEKYMSFQDISKIDSLAKEVSRAQEERERKGLLFPIGDDTVKLRSPLRDCGQGCLYATSEFGMRNHPVLKIRRLHKGIDLRAKTGTAVVSSLNGKVLANRTEYSFKKTGKGKKKKKTKIISGYGHYVIVVHPEANLETLYAHLSAFKSKAGAEVKQGDLIALSGNTGIGTNAHLHFETHVPAKGGGFKPVNPRTFIGSLFDSVAAFFSFFKLNV